MKIVAKNLNYITAFTKSYKKFVQLLETLHYLLIDPKFIFHMRRFSYSSIVVKESMAVLHIQTHIHKFV